VKLFPDRKCPHCNHKIDADTPTPGVDGDAKEGDVSICFHCGEWGIFGPGAETILRPTETQRNEVMSDEDARQTIFKAQMLIAGQRRKSSK
jgi:hypothetical protein